MSRTLIIGSQGLVGSAIARQIPDAVLGTMLEEQKPNERYVDISKMETLTRVFSEVRPHVVYLCAAIAHVDKCEDQSTGIVNLRGVASVLRLCEKYKSRLVWFSSSYVFDGQGERPYTETDIPNPIQNYGVQKLYMENLISHSPHKHLIVRTVGVFGKERKRKNFVQQILRSIWSGKPVYTPMDQWMNPVLSDDLAECTVSLVDKGKYGIYHVAGDECLTKYDFAKRVAAYFGYENLVLPKTSVEMNQPAKRPMMGCLGCSKLSEIMPIPSLNSGVQKFLSSSYA